MKLRGAFRRIVLCGAAVAGFSGCGGEPTADLNLSPGVVIPQDGMAAAHEDLAGRVAAAAESVMEQPGLAGAVGGVHLRLLKAGTQEILLPLPQLAAGQVPVCYHIRSTPPEAVAEYRLRKRAESNDVVTIRLAGNPNQEVRIDWSAVIVLGRRISPETTDPGPYRVATACVQSQAAEIQQIADALWPASGAVQDYAANIQRYLLAMQQVQPPRSLDALGILASGMNGICTANANVASALLRSRGIASRSLAVIPPISQRLEMHRIVEYFDDGTWHPFDPSSLHSDVPLQPWQSVIMARTTVADEDRAMTPRTGAALGCPLAQELELLTDGITLEGQDFFWTLAKPIAAFEPDDEAISLATDAWKRFQSEGTLSPEQVAAGSATNATEFLERLRPQ